MPSLPAIMISALAQDAMSVFQWPGSATVGAWITRLFENRAKAAREILLDELASGNRLITEAEADESVAIFYRYMRAAHEGAARLNLRLLASVIAGQAHLGILRADEFLYFADVIAGLRREEIILIGTLYRFGPSSPSGSADNESQASTTDDYNGYQAAKEQLIPVPFRSEAELRATAGAAMRTGLITAVAGFGGDLGFFSTPLMDRLHSLAPFEAALKAEPLHPSR